MSECHNLELINRLDLKLATLDQTVTSKLNTVEQQVTANKLILTGNGKPKEGLVYKVERVILLLFIVVVLTGGELVASLL